MRQQILRGETTADQSQWEEPMSSHRGNVDPETRNHLHELAVEFNWKLDHGEPAGFSDLFEPNGAFITEQATFSGSEALDEFASMRTAMVRTSRSVLSNHRLVRLSDDVIEGAVLVILYMHDSADGGVPDAHSVAEYRDVYARGNDGHWRFRERRAVPVFTRIA
jgi:hypothetical protein